LAASLSRPGGNLTGINLFTSELVAKRLEVLRDLLPQAKRVGVLVNPADVGASDAQLKDIDAAARAMGLQIQVHNADTRDEIDAAFEAMGRDRPDAVFVSSTVFLNGRRVQLAQLSLQSDWRFFVICCPRPGGWAYSSIQPMQVPLMLN